MNIGSEVGKQRTRVVVNGKAFNDMSNSVNVLRKINFDPKQFNTYTRSDGIQVTLRQAPGDETHDHRWTITNNSTTTFSCNVGSGTVDIMGDVVAWNVGDGKVDSLAYGDNLIYGKSMRDGNGGILMKANTSSTTLPSQSELGNNTFGFAIGSMNTISGVITQYLHSDFSVEYPKLKPTTTPDYEPKLYQVITLREYNEEGNIVAIGSETEPLPAGHYYEQNWDWIRAHS